MNSRPKSIARGPVIVMAVTSSVTIGAILYSHYSQVWDREVMREGVERDKERLRMKRKMRKEQEKKQQQQSEGVVEERKYDWIKSIQPWWSKLSPASEHLIAVWM
eukprot:CAMPEP_0119016702 /NCGR_PEP_ID=MMETSP1176-20130426/14187_1 /TAXON_ID=265551 /ORGANISM="Synedropsis recta cf, Strain CCMP1620" /LENGTH=104 /DNA_ID=CAMNT_0006970221 /DNA_START=54 /DNA_END=366 /DNA_ORIENTATION=-